MSKRTNGLPPLPPPPPPPPPVRHAPVAGGREPPRRRPEGRDDRDACASDVALFHAALHGHCGDGEGAGGEDAASSGGGGQGGRRHPPVDAPEAAPTAVGGIFGLFGAGGTPAAAPAPVATPESAAAARTPAQLVAALAEAVQVGVDGTRTVRVQLAADLLPGVQFQVSQDAGRWVVDFDAAHAPSAELLEGAGEQMAAVLARRLGRGVEIRVQPLRRVDGGLALPRCFVHDPSTPSEQGTSA